MPKYFPITRTYFQYAIQTSLDVAVIMFYLAKTVVSISYYWGLTCSGLTNVFILAGMKLAVIAQWDICFSGSRKKPHGSVLDVFGRSFVPLHGSSSSWIKRGGN
ncbi:hypothetical protein GQ55_6G170400 [Panicum hallii var. hallii]|jgi:hypothetical protein|uniref:Uncharacterized protein n=1 Tax=Panicum hallii var. hallii TaxID=1504633 RepID=A0A2T7D6S5_9POAL|nr:hypothetical protein GQ55_6G170400 [Panicum hallii var. hallii]